MLATNALGRPAQFDRANQHRRSMIAKIQIARQQLAIAEDDYRQILLEETGETSLKQLPESKLDKVLARMKRLGFKPLPRGGAKPAAHPMAAKARALWISLHHLAVVRNPSEEALEAFAKRQLGCERLIWARQSDAHRLIEALKDMGRRAGWSAPAGASPVQLQERLCQAILVKLQAAGAVPADWTLDIAAWRLCGIVLAGEDPVSAERYARTAKALGDKLRALAPTGAAT
jgi:phage gp16-like protein